eukprot:jgi/Hompol1/5147/HPOL_001893-RA
MHGNRSGTLSPLQSFSSELGTSFQYVFEASHVIKDDQIIKRWSQTGTLKRLSDVKKVFVEPRGNLKNEVETLIAEFDAACLVSTGAILLCVHRGKMSEGIDFADHRARGVVCIGMPFPNIKDLQVQQKRDYNSSHTSRGLLSGSDWYEVQAFRALNQALGRCIRHRNDWGAIILVDERFSRPKNIASLSKWIRSKAQLWPSLRNAEMQLKEFFDHRISVERQQKESEAIAKEEQRKKAEEIRNQRTKEVFERLERQRAELEQRERAKMTTHKPVSASSVPDIVPVHNIRTTSTAVCPDAQAGSSIAPLSSPKSDEPSHGMQSPQAKPPSVTGKVTTKKPLDLSKFVFSPSKAPNESLSRHIDEANGDSEAQAYPVVMALAEDAPAAAAKSLQQATTLGCAECGTAIVSTNAVHPMTDAAPSIAVELGGSKFIQVSCSEPSLSITQCFVSSGPVTLNAFWSEKDNAAFALGSCHSCGNVVG